MSALRNQLDEMRHWTGPVDPNTTSGSTADLREQLDTEREKVEKAEEEVCMALVETLRGIVLVVEGEDGGFTLIKSCRSVLLRL